MRASINRTRTMHAYLRESIYQYILINIQWRNASIQFKFRAGFHNQGITLCVDQIQKCFMQTYIFLTVFIRSNQSEIYSSPKNIHTHW